MRKQNVIDFQKFFESAETEATDALETPELLGDESESTEEETEELPVVSPTPLEADVSPADIAPVDDIPMMEPPVTDGLLPEASNAKVVILNGYAGHLDETHPNKTITDSIIQKFGSDVQEVNLYQLNITPLTDDGREPADGMSQVYSALEGADVVIVSTDLNKGQISSLMQCCLDRMANYSQGSMKNKIMASVITGAKDSYMTARGTILNFALEMGMLVGGDCNVFCATEEGQLGEYETEASNLVVVANQLAEATIAIRSASVAPMDDIAGVEGDVMPFDKFDQEGSVQGDEMLSDIPSYDPATDGAESDQVHAFMPTDEEGSDVDGDAGSESIDQPIPVDELPAEEGEDFGIDDEVQPFNPEEDDDDEEEEITEEEEEEMFDFSTFERKRN